MLRSLTRYNLPLIAQIIADKFYLFKFCVNLRDQRETIISALDSDDGDLYRVVSSSPCFSERLP